jgi:hypothetical protein
MFSWFRALVWTFERTKAFLVACLGRIPAPKKKRRPIGRCFMDVAYRGGQQPRQQRKDVRRQKKIIKNNVL